MLNACAKTVSRRKKSCVLKKRSERVSGSRTLNCGMFLWRLPQARRNLQLAVTELQAVLVVVKAALDESRRSFAGRLQKASASASSAKAFDTGGPG